VAERYPRQRREEAALPGLGIGSREVIRRLQSNVGRATAAVLHHGRRRGVWVFTSAFIATELLADIGSPGAAAWIDAALATLMIGWYLGHRPTPETNLTLGLTVLPLMRLFSFTSVVTALPLAASYVTTSVPVIVAVAFVARTLGLSGGQVGGKRTSVAWLPIAAAVAGVPLGLGGYLTLGPWPSITPFAWLPMVGAATALAFAAFAEELVFRGLLQILAQQTFACWPASVTFASALFAVMYLGSGAPAYALYLGVVSLLWGWAVLRTKSLWPAVTGHALFAVSAGVFWPLVAHLLS
jgi:membrane protease YdiL (CAAX protease family)